MEVPRFDYSDLPPGSRIVVEREGQTLRITIPPAGPWWRGKSLWKILLAILLTIFVITALWLIWIAALVLILRRLWPSAPFGPLIDLLGKWLPQALLTSLAPLGAIAAFLWVLGHERITIELDERYLTIDTRLWRWGKAQRLPRRAITDIRRYLGGLRIYVKKGYRRARITRLAEGETRWLARTLRAELQLPQ